MKLKITQAVVVEGKYDAMRLANIVDGMILTTDGFAVFKEKPMQELFKRIAKKQGLIILTDSDDAGFRIRHFITGLAPDGLILQAYVPSVTGKEPRKAEAGKEGLLGVEGIPDAVILKGIETALQGQEMPNKATASQDEILYSDLYEWGLTGGKNSSVRRRAFLKELKLPLRLSKKELLRVLNTLYTKEQLLAQIGFEEQYNIP